MSSENASKPLRIPPWLRARLPEGPAFGDTSEVLRDLRLNTVCQSAKCPNCWECFSNKVATFMILGDQCTRNCAFCNISPGRVQPPDPDEPRRVAEGARRLDLRHVVVTSVTRDDLPDGGSAHFSATILALRRVLPGCTVEVLIPDFRGDEAALRTVLDAGPDILNHNVETVPGLYERIRPQAHYRQSLELLERSKRIAPAIPTKSGLMVGLGETDAELMDVVRDLADVRCDVVTIGQYMRPTREHPEVLRYVHPDVFEEYAEAGRKLGVPQMYCAPRVRSSYNAAKFLDDVNG